MSTHIKTAAKVRQYEGYKISFAAFALGEAFSVFSAIMFAVKGNTIGVLQSIEAMVLLVAPMLAEKLFHFRLARWLYIYVSVHCLGPLLGHSYTLFYITNWWDKALHTSSGVIFTLLGLYIPKLLNNGKEVSLPLKVFCALCFAITMSAVWELFEYGYDSILGADTQNDTYITAINSYFLGDDPAVMGRITNIESVIVNGIELPGYIDIGLIDTMNDMLVETVGAVVAAAVAIIDKGRHPAIIPDTVKAQAV